MALYYYTDHFLEEKQILLQSGNKKIKLEIKEPVFLENAYKPFVPLILFPDDTVRLLNGPKDIAFVSTGDLMRDNDFRFLNEFIKQHGPLSHLYSKDELIPIVDVKGIHKSLDSIYFSKFRKHLLPSPKNNKIRDSLLYDIYKQRVSFLNKHSNELTYKFKSFFSNYLFYRYLSFSINGINSSTKYDELPDRISKFIEKTNIFNVDSLFGIPSYRQFLIGLNTYYVNNIGREVSVSNKINSAIKIAGGKSLDFLLFSIVKKDILGKGLNSSAESVIELFDKYCSSQEYKLAMKEFISDISIVSSTNKESDYLLTTKGKKIDFLTFIKSNGNRFFYVDLWASWCMPCIEEFSYSMKIRKQLEDLPIDFIYISFDKSISSWKAANITHTGVLNDSNSFLMIENFNSSFAKKSKVNSLPRYMIVNGKGKVILSDAPRPSEENIVLQIRNVILKEALKEY